MPRVRHNPEHTNHCVAARSRDRPHVRGLCPGGSMTSSLSELTRVARAEGLHPLTRGAVSHRVALPEGPAVDATVLIARTVTGVVVMIARAVAAGIRRL